MEQVGTTQKATKRARARTCIGCGSTEGADAMVRVVIAEGEVVFDLAGGAFGRGAHVHPSAACLERAARGGLARSMRARVETSPDALRAALETACDRRMTGLLLSARRTGTIAVGADAAREALRRGAPLAIVAVDAGSVAAMREVATAVTEGRAVAWKTKDELGALLGSAPVAICAIGHAGIAGELAKTRRLGSLACSRFPEVR